MYADDDEVVQEGEVPLPPLADDPDHGTTAVALEWYFYTYSTSRYSRTPTYTTTTTTTVRYYST